MAAYRAGDLDTARSLWLELLEAEPRVVRGAERGRVLFNLGNLALRAQADLEAVGWYTASLRLRPRDADTWANLEFARLGTGLEPADRGDLKDTLARLFGAWTRGESRIIAWLALMPLALALGFEALRGGRAARWACLVALFLASLGSIPWVSSCLSANEESVLVIAERGAAVHTEPRSDAERMATSPAGEILERLAVYPDWLQVRLTSGRRGWLRGNDAFTLDR